MVLFWRSDLPRIASRLRESGVVVRELPQRQTAPLWSSIPIQLSRIRTILTANNGACDPPIAIAALSQYGEQSHIVLSSIAVDATSGGESSSPPRVPPLRRMEEASLPHLETTMASYFNWFPGTIDINLQIPNGYDAKGNALFTLFALAEHCGSQGERMTTQSSHTFAARTFCPSSIGTFRCCNAGKHNMKKRLEVSMKRDIDIYPFARMCKLELYPYAGFTHSGGVSIKFDGEKLSELLHSKLAEHDCDLNHHGDRIRMTENVVNRWQDSGEVEEEWHVALVAFLFSELHFYNGAQVHLLKRCHNVQMAKTGIGTRNQAGNLYNVFQSIRAHFSQHIQRESYLRLEGKTRLFQPQLDCASPTPPRLCASGELS